MLACIPGGLVAYPVALCDFRVTQVLQTFKTLIYCINAAGPVKSTFDYIILDG